MFVETYLTSAISDFLEKYFTNFDKQNFSLSWLGKATVNDLILKADALDKSLPIKIVGGKVGTVIINASFGIRSSTIALTLKDVYVLAAPPSEILYNKNEEEKSALESKRDELVSLQNQLNATSKSNGNSGNGEDYGFFQQLFSTAINNITLTLENIHIRFEDSRSASPYSVGLTLKSTSVRSSDANWNPTDTDSGAKTTFKLFKVDGLGLYLNAGERNSIATNLNDRSPENLVRILATLKNLLNNPGDKLTYVLQPFYTTAKGKITLAPEKLDNPFSLPKTDLEFEMPDLAIELTNAQYAVTLRMGDEFEGMHRSKKNLEFRPSRTPYQGNAKIWWRFAYQALLAEVQRRRQNWNWNHIKSHRDLCRQYEQAYSNLISNDNPSEAQTAEVQRLEDKIDNFNIILIQKKQEIFNKRKQQRVTQKSKALWFGIAVLTKEDLDEILVGKFSDEEMAKLYEVMDYGSIKDPTMKYHQDYIGFNLKINMPQFRVGLFNVKNYVLEKCLELVISGLSVGYATFPANKGLKLDVALDNIRATGIKRTSSDDTEPSDQLEDESAAVDEAEKLPAEEETFILRPFNEVKEGAHFLTVEFEKHILENGNNSKLIKVRSDQVLFIYDAKSIQGIVDCFTWPSDVQLSATKASTIRALLDASNYTYEQMMNLANSTEKVDLDIYIEAPFVVFPEDGIFLPSKCKLSVNLGTLVARVIPRKGGDVGPDFFKQIGNISPAVLMLAYNHYQLQLNDFEIFFALPDKQFYLDPNGEKAKLPFQILKTGTTQVDLNHCIVTNDTRFPALTTDISIPLLEYETTDYILLRIVTGFLTFPFAKRARAKYANIDWADDPRANYESDVQELVSPPQIRQSFTSRISASTDEVSKIVRQASTDKNFDPQIASQFTNLYVKFNVKEFKMKFSTVVDLKKNITKPFIDFQYKQFCAIYSSRTFGETYIISVGEVTAEYLGSHLVRDEPLYLLKTSGKIEGSSAAACSLIAFIASSECPKTGAGIYKLKVKINICSVDVVLFEETLVKALEVSKQVFLAIKEGDKDDDDPKAIVLSKAKPKVREENENDIDIKLEAQLTSFTATAANHNKSILKMCVDKLYADVEDGALQTKAILEVGDFEILNMDGPTVYPKILGAINKGESFMNANVCLFKRLDRGDLEPDVDIELSLASHQLVLLGSALDNMLSFINKFQVAKEAVIQLSKSWSKKVLRFVKTVGKNDTKIKLALDINAPIVLLPKETTSNDAIILRLGHMEVKNELSVQPTKSGRNAILDEVLGKLTGLQFRNCFVASETQAIISEISIVAPVSVTINMTRNLSSSWYSELPKVKVALKSDPVQLELSADDLVLALTSVSSVYNAIQQNKVLMKPIVTGLEDEQSPLAQGEPESPPAYLCTFSADIFLDVISGSLYTATPLLQHKFGILERDDKFRFGRGNVGPICVTWKYWNNTDFKLNVNLDDLSLEDTRSGSQDVTKFIEWKTLVPSDEKCVLYTMTCEKTELPTMGKAYKFISNFASIEAVLNISFLRAILNMANTIVASAPRFRKSLLLTQISQLDGDPSFLASGRTKVRKEEPTPVLDFHVDIPGVTALVLEDVNSKETNAIMITMSGVVDVKSDGATESHGGGAYYLAINAAKRNPGLSTVPLDQILRPTSVVVQVDLTPMTGININLDVSPISVHISTGTVLILSKIQKAIANLPVPGDGLDDEFIDYSNVWDSMENCYRSYWFLRTKDLQTNAEHVLTTSEIETISKISRKDEIKEKITIKDLKINLSLEVGAGVITTPLALANGVMNCDIVNWTRNLLITGNLKVSGSYNNTHFGVWEYLLEPVEVPKPFGHPSTKWWEINFTLTKPLGTFNSKLDLTSKDIAEFTLSKTVIAILLKILRSYEIATSATVSEKDVKSPPYIFKNDSGFDLTLDIHDTPFVMFLEDGSSANTIIMATGHEVDLGLKPEVGIGEKKTQLQRTVKVTIPQLQFSESIIIANAKPRFFELNMTSQNGQKYGILFDIVTNNSSCTYVTARSIVEISNILRVPVEVYNSTRSSGVQLLTTIEPHSTWALPLSVIYEQSAGICFKALGYKISTVPFSWLNLRNNPTSTWATVTAPESGVGDNANIKVLGQTLSSVIGNTDTRTCVGENYKIYLKGHLLINNLLPILLTFQSDGRTVSRIEPGKSANIFSVTPTRNDQYEFNLTMANYRGKNWFTRVVVKNNEEEIMSLVFTSEDRSKTVCFGCKKAFEDDRITLSVYCPYWMMNHAGLELKYKSSTGVEIISHPGDSDKLLMYAYEKELGQSKIAIQCEGSDWSTSMSLDAAGVPGGFICKSADQEYPLTVEVTLSKCLLTKIVKFTPRNTIVNTSPFDLVFNEADREDDEILVKSQSATPFWPRGTLGQFNVKVKGTDELSINVHYDRDNDSFVQLDNKYGGLHVVVRVTDTKVTIALSEFMPGEVPIIIVNDAQDIKITYYQDDTDEFPAFLDSGESILYTWYNLSTTSKILNWSPAGYKETTRLTLDLEKDANGYFTASNRNTYHWISVRSGVQRILLITQNTDLIDSLTKLQSVTDEAPLLEINFQIEGVGCSLVNNEIGQDILYIRGGSTPPLWEASSIGQTHFKLMNPQHTSILEQGYQNYIAGALPNGPVALNEQIKVDFSDFKMYTPLEQQLKRHAYKPGIAFKFNIYSQMVDADLRVGTVQIDNQLASCIYPRTFVVAPLPKSVMIGTEVRPAIIILKLSRRTTPASNVHYISGTLIIQEFCVSADMSLVDAVLKIYQSDSIFETEVLAAQYNEDMLSARQKLSEYYDELVKESTAGRTIFVFEELEFYRLKFNVTFALRGGDGSTRNPLLFLTQGFGAMVGNITEKPIDINGVSIKNMRLTFTQLLWEMFNRYKFEILKNVYSIFFELDVIGNPFKLLTGIGSGIGSLLTEPFQGALQGNLLEGVSIGVGTLVDSTVGNLAESISKISGSLGKGADAVGLHIIGAAVGGFSSIFGGIKQVTHGTEREAAAVRPPRPFKLNSYLEPYSPNKSEGLNILKQILHSYSFSDSGAIQNHTFVSQDKILVFTDKMAFYVSVYPYDVSLIQSILWGYKWTDFADISAPDGICIDFDQKDAGGYFFVRKDPHHKVEILNPETHKWILQKSQEFLQK